MKNFDSRTYSINDFRGWNDRKELELQPKFQRRSVWSDKARSYLMDSVVRGKPMPHPYTEEHLVKQPAVALFATLGAAKSTYL